MKAVTWHGKRDVRVDTVPDPKIEQPTDAIVRITSSGICGSDLHLYEVMGAYMAEGDILGHEPIGVVEEVGSEVEHIAVGDRVVIQRFTLACPMRSWICLSNRSIIGIGSTTRSALKTWPRTTSRWRTRRMLMRSSRKRKTAQ